QTRGWRREGAVRSGQHSELLALCQAIHVVRSVLHRGRWTINPEPPDADRRGLADHRQPALSRPHQRPATVRHPFASRGAGEGWPHLAQLRRLCPRLHHGPQRQQEQRDRGPLCERCGGRQTAGGVLGLRAHRAERTPGRTGEGRPELDRGPGRCRCPGRSQAPQRSRQGGRRHVRLLRFPTEALASTRPRNWLIMGPGGVMLPLQTHCWQSGGTFICDMGDLPGPPTALYYVLDAVGLVVLALGLYSLVTGRILLKLGRLKQLSTPGAVRVIGLSILLICLP